MADHFLIDAHLLSLAKATASLKKKKKKNKQQNAPHNANQTKPKTTIKP